MKMVIKEGLNKEVLESLNQFLRCNPERVDVWLFYACLELSQHKLLPFKDKQQRRMDIAKKALKHSNDSRLVEFSLHQIAKIVDSESLLKIVHSLLNITIEKADSDAYKIILGNNLPCHPNLIYLLFFLNCVKYVFGIFELNALKSVLLEAQKLLIYMEAQKFNKFSKTILEALTFSNPLWLNFIMDILNTFLAKGYLDSNVFQYLSAVNHCSALVALNCLTSSTTDILLQLQDFINSGAPRIGECFAYEMYASLCAQSKKLVLIDVLEDLYNVASKIVHMSTISSEFNQPYVWFQNEDLSLYKKYFLTVYGIEKTRKEYSSVCLEIFLQLLVPTEYKNRCLHKIFQTLILSPIYMSQYSSNDPIYLNVLNAWGSALPLIQATLKGILNLQKSSNYHSSESSLSFTDVFGVDLSLSYASEIGFIYEFLESVVSTYDNVKENYSYSIDSTFIHKIIHLSSILNKQIFKQQIPSILFSITSSATMLLWIEKDQNLISTVIGHLTYLGYDRLSKKVLMQYEKNKEAWIAYCTFLYARNPESCTFKNISQILQKYTKTADSLNDLEFIFSWIRLQCLFHINLSNKQNPKYKYSINLVPPSIINLLTSSLLNDPKYNVDIGLDNLWSKEHSIPRKDLEAAHDIAEKAHFEMDYDLPTSNNVFYPNKYFLYSYAIIILTSMLHGAKSAYEKCRSLILDLLEDVEKQFRPITEIKHVSDLNKVYEGKRGNIDKPAEHDAEMTLDVLLLTIQASLIWPPIIIANLASDILQKFPNHTRAYDVLVHVSKNISLMKFRQLLPKNDKFAQSVISDLKTGLPAYYRNITYFEDAIQENFPSPCLLHRYLTYLALAHYVKDVFKVKNDNSFLQLLNTSEKLRMQCPFSKRLWLHHLYNSYVAHSGDNKKLENSILSELELAEERDIVFICDPLELIVNNQSDE